MQSPGFYSTHIRFRLIAPIGVLTLALGVAGCKSPKKAEPPAASADTWATVDGRPITRDDVEKNFRQTQDPASTLSPEEAMTLKLSILNEMILQDLLLAKARALKIEVPDAELDASYAAQKKNVTDAVFEEELKKRKLVAADMRESVRRELIAKKLLDQEVVSKIAVTDQEVNDFFTANRAQFTVAEESYRIAQIVITPDRAAQPANRTGNDATTAQEAAFKVRMVMERLKAGTPFADVAMDYSEDPQSAPRGGDLGLVPVSALKQAPPALREAVIGQKPGTVNVATSGGAHTIVAVIAHEQAGERDLSTPGVRDGITATLKGRKEQLLRTAYLSAARGDTDVVNHVARRVVESQGKVQ
ncbi:MAG: SurA N-terminal domain-containing protein [Vicinamibacterales bacterium]